MLQPLLIDDPARFTNLVHSCGVDGHVAVALLVPPDGPGGRTKERTLGRIPASDENALDALGRLLALEGVIDLRVNVRLRAYCDGSKVEESKFVVRLVPKPPEQPAEAPPSASHATGAEGAVQASRDAPRSGGGSPEDGAAEAHDDGRAARKHPETPRAGLSAFDAGLQEEGVTRLAALEVAVAALQASPAIALLRDQIARIDLQQVAQNAQIQEIDVRMDESVEALHARIAKLEAVVTSGGTKTEALEAQVRAIEPHNTELLHGLGERQDGLEEVLEAIVEKQATLEALIAQLNRVVGVLVELVPVPRR
jgi:hypothetical protein